MILPTKAVSPDRALLAVGAGVLRQLSEPKTVSRLWADFRGQGQAAPSITFDWFVLALDLLYALGLVELDAGRVQKAERPIAVEAP